VMLRCVVLCCVVLCCVVLCCVVWGMRLVSCGGLVGLVRLHCCTCIACRARIRSG
jgi:hypothetical protein